MFHIEEFPCPLCNENLNITEENEKLIFDETQKEGKLNLLLQCTNCEGKFMATIEPPVEVSEPCLN
jgi:hypothetical protein